MEHLKKDIYAFSTLIREWLPAHTSLVRSAISVKSNGELNVVQARASLIIGEAPIHQQSFRLETASVFACSEAVSAEGHFPQMLRELEQGCIEVSGHEHRLACKTAQNLSAYHSPFFHPSQRGGPRLPTLMIRSDHSKFQMYYLSGGQEELDWELKAAEKPFHSIDDLTRFLGLDPDGDPRIEVTAQFPAVIAPARS